MTDAETERIYRILADTYQQILLGDNWHVRGRTVTNGTVVIDVRTSEITWPDLAPDGEPREARTLRMPGECSVGAIVAVAAALASLVDKNR